MHLAGEYDRFRGAGALKYGINPNNRPALIQTLALSSFSFASIHLIQFLFAFLNKVTVRSGIYCRRKEFVSQGTNSTLLELTFTEKEEGGGRKNSNAASSEKYTDILILFMSGTVYEWYMYFYAVLIGCHLTPPPSQNPTPLGCLIGLIR